MIRVLSNIDKRRPVNFSIFLYKTTTDKGSDFTIYGNMLARTAYQTSTQVVFEK